MFYINTQNKNLSSLNIKNKSSLAYRYFYFGLLTSLLPFIMSLISFTFLYFTTISKIKKDVTNGENYLAICMLVRFDQIYLREFIEHYKKLEVDKIFIYDNNDVNVSINNLVTDYINEGYVKIIKFPGKYVQHRIYRIYYKTFGSFFAWNLFIDIDEFLVFTNKNMTLKKYLKNKKFNKCDHIRIAVLNYMDNDLVYYDNRTLMERFQIPTPNSLGIGLSKYFVKPYLENVKVDVHTAKYGNITSCDYKGEILPENHYESDLIKYGREIVVINHYHFKSTEEFVWRIKRGSNARCYDTQTDEEILNTIKYYFRYNRVTDERINLFKKHFPSLANEIDKIAKR